MSLWVWIVVVTGTLLAVSLLVGLALAAILGSITREMSGKQIRPSMKAMTASSLAAFIAAGNVPPVFKAR